MIDWIKCSDRMPEKEGYYLIATYFPEFKTLFENSMFNSLAYFKTNKTSSLFPNLGKEGFYVYTYTLGNGFAYQDKVDYWAEVNFPKKEEPNNDVYVKKFKNFFSKFNTYEEVDTSRLKVYDDLNSFLSTSRIPLGCFAEFSDFIVSFDEDFTHVNVFKYRTLYSHVKNWDEYITLVFPIKSTDGRKIMFFFRNNDVLNSAIKEALLDKGLK